MEFVSRKTCIEHYESQFPNLPRYMIEMALDYDLAQGGSSNEKPATGKEKRKAKKAAKEREPIKREVNELIKHAMATATPLEIDCGRVIKGENYTLPPKMPGYVNIDGDEAVAQLEADDKSDGLISMPITNGRDEIID